MPDVVDEPKMCDICGKEQAVEQEIVSKYSIPFKCPACGNIHFKYRALNGLIFIWPKPIITTQGKIFIPEQSQNSFKSSEGVVLAAGKGCTNKKTGDFTECEVRVGDEVLYDKSIPWHLEIKAADGTKHKVDLTNMFDVNAVIL
jgi:co-chaperonin GroES (HSP10)/predicted RNA-binding Zn-ribbon protein involved in translation (DUF1610 family)